MCNVKVIVFICCVIVVATAQEPLQNPERDNAVNYFKKAIQKLPPKAAVYVGGPKYMHKVTDIDTKQIYATKNLHGVMYQIYAAIYDETNTKWECDFFLKMYNTDQLDEIEFDCLGVPNVTFVVGKL